MTGDVTGNQVTMGAMMGGASFGVASFTGTVTPAAAVGPGSTITGAFSVTSGPFTGTGGAWNAGKPAPGAAPPPPGAWGLAPPAPRLVASALWPPPRPPAPRARSPRPRRPPSEG